MPRHRPSRLSVAALAMLLLSSTSLQGQVLPGQFGPPPLPPAAAVPDGFGGPKAKRVGVMEDRTWQDEGLQQSRAGARSAAADLDADALRIDQADPPIVVGRIARLEGAISQRVSGGEEWQSAALNSLVVSGTAIWAEPAARSAIEAGQSRIYLDAETALQIDSLDEAGIRATLAQGSVYLLLDSLDEFGSTVELATPEASVATAVDGRYLIEAAAPDGSRPGRVAVFEGRLDVTLVGMPDAIRLGPGEALRFGPEGAQRERAGAPTPLMAWALGTVPRMAIPPIARGMTGIAELGATGRWERSAEYGEVWFPPVAQGWSPYSDGSWEWFEPWGWRWRDAAPWGFATSHYGRWVQDGPRWGWAPAPVPVVGAPRMRPAWAPAIVAFFGGVAIGGVSGRPVGWVPLGAHEPWYPWYRASPAYVARVNLRQVPRLVPVRDRWVAYGGHGPRWGGPRQGHADVVLHARLGEFRNRRAAIQVPERVLLASLPVRSEARRIGPEALRRADLRDVPLRPIIETRGLTAREVDRLGLSRDAWRDARRDDRAVGPPERARAALVAVEVRDRNGRHGRDDRGVDGRTPRLADELPRRITEEPDRTERRPDDLDSRRGRLGQAVPIDGRQGEQRRQRDSRPGLVEEEDRRPRDGLREENAVRSPAEQQRPERRELRRQAEEDRRDGTRPRDAQPNGNRVRDQDARREQQEFRRNQLDGEARQQQGERRLPLERDRRQQLDQERERQQELRRQQLDQARRQQREQQADRARQQQREAQRQQMESAQRQQQDALRQQQREAQRQQMESAQRQQQDALRQQQREAQRQQMESARRQQQDALRQQQREAQRQQMESARRQQQEALRQQQREAQRQQMESARRQQQEALRQQQREAQRQQVDESRQQQREARQEARTQRREERGR
jgi:hypothetical protein